MNYEHVGECVTKSILLTIKPDPEKNERRKKKVSVMIIGIKSDSSVLFSDRLSPVTLPWVVGNILFLAAKRLFFHRREGGGGGGGVLAALEMHKHMHDICL